MEEMTMQFYMQNVEDVLVIWSDQKVWIALQYNGECVGSTWADDWNMDEDDILIIEEEAQQIMAKHSKLLEPLDMSTKQREEFERIFDISQYCPVCKSWCDNWKWEDKFTQTWKCLDCGAILKNDTISYNKQYQQTETSVVSK